VKGKKPQRQRRGERSELMDILIARQWTELLGPFPKDPSEVGGQR